PLLFQDGFVHGPEGCRRSVGVAEGLEISDIFRLRPLLMHPVAHGPELLDQIIAAIPGEISRSPGAAKGAASDGDGTVPVGTGEAGVQGDFERLLPVGLAQMVIPRVISLFSPPKGGF